MSDECLPGSCYYSTGYLGPVVVKIWKTRTTRYSLPPDAVEATIAEVL